MDREGRYGCGDRNGEGLVSSPPGDLDESAGRGISTGKRRGLDAVSTPGGVFAVLAIDHLSALSATIRPDDADAVADSQLAETKVRLVEWLADRASGVLIDPVVGLQPVIDGGVLPGSTGLLLGLEDGDYASLDQAPRLFEGWDVARDKEAGADAIKCSFLYDPFEPSEAAHRFVEKLVADCARADLPLFAEPLAPPTLQADRRRTVVETAHRIGALGVDVLKLEFPATSDGHSTETEWYDACREVTETARQPWTLLSAGETFDTFARQFTIACKAGASGYVAGRAVWQDLVVRGLQAGSQELTEARSRLALLTETAEGNARPWAESYSPAPRAESEVL